MLNISNVISVSVTQIPSGVQAYNVNNVALYTTESFLSNPDNDVYRIYVTAAEVGVDFGTNSEAYSQAVAFFSQVPNVLNGGGSLIIFPSEDTAISTVTVNAAGTGYEVGDVLPVVQSGGANGTLTVATVNGSGGITGVTVTTPGYGYAVATGLSVTGGEGSGATINITAVTQETLGNAIARTKDLIFFVGIISTFYPSGADRKTLADAVQAYGDKMLMLSSSTFADIAGVFTDIMEAGDYATRCLYYSTSAADARLFAAAYAGRAFSVNFEAVNGTLTMNLKELITITADPGVTQSVYDDCETAGVDFYANIAGEACVISTGANEFFDQVYNLIWFVAALKVAGFNALRQVGGKVPQTEPGMTVLKGAYRNVCEQARANAYVAPGAWNSPDTFGNQEAMISNIEQFGYYIYSAPVNQQSQADREAREAPLVQIAIKEAGAIQKSSVIVNINA